jgi:hypothetical protein
MEYENVRGQQGDVGQGAQPQREGKVARAIESKTSRLPSDLFLWAGVGAILGSLTLQILGRKEAGNFVGHWVPTVLLLGLYNKVVKVAGHDRYERDVH